MGIDRGTIESARSPTASQRILVFRLAEQRYGIPLKSVSEVLPLPLLSRPAAAPTVLAGFFVLEGTVVAVLRLDCLFGSPGQLFSLFTPLVLVRSLRFPAALVVDELVGIAPVPADSFLRLQETYSCNGCSEGLAQLGDDRVVVLSAERILLVAEQHRLAELTALEQARLAELDGAER